MRSFACLFGRRPTAAVSPRRPSPRPLVEALESRWVPSTINTSSSTDWSGYAVATNPGAVTSVSGSWVVPTVTGSGYSAAWVGIDGFNSNSVEQTGVEMDFINGRASYYAWYEMYPNAPVTISSLSVKPGDTINASVNYLGNGNFTLTLTDGSQSFSTTQHLSNPQLSSAEWITEAPVSWFGPLPLANFGSINFTNAQATVNGVTGAITNTSSSAWQAAAASIYSIDLVNGRTGAIEAAPTALDSTGEDFTINFCSPPASTTPPSSSVATSTTLSGVVNRNYRLPAVTFTATVTPQSGSGLPTGTVEVLSGNTVIGSTQLRNVNGVEEVVFTVTFSQPGNYNISVVYTGGGGFQGSTSNTITVSVG
jgi:Peptidase A4 family/Bacterial Ig-like domain (group 3)